MQIKWEFYRHWVEFFPEKMTMAKREKEKDERGNA